MKTKKSHSHRAPIDYWTCRSPDPRAFVKSMGTALQAAESHTPSLVELVPPVVAEAIKNLPENYVNKAERDLKKLLRPSHLASRLRVQFWLEYERALAEQKNMKMENVFAGCCPKQMFYEFVLKDKKQLAWIITPPTEYMVALRASLQQATEVIQDILDIPLPRKMTATDVKLAKLKVEIWEKLQDRVHGAVAQNVNARHIHAHQQLPEKTDRKNLMDELKAEHSAPDVIEVNAEEKE